MASNSYQCCSDRTTQKRGGLYSVDSFTALSAQTAALNKKLDSLGALTMSVSSSVSCELYDQSEHDSVACQVGNPFLLFSFEQANFVSSGGNKSNFNPYSNTNNPGWRSHPNFSWNNNQQKAPPVSNNTNKICKRRSQTWRI